MERKHRWWPARRRWRIMVSVALLTLTAVTLIGLLAQLPLASAPAAPAANRAILIRGATLIDVDQGIARPGMTIGIADDMIIHVAPDGTEPAFTTPPRIIDARGRFVMPGLWDSHIHTLDIAPHGQFAQLIGHGVTSIRDMGDGCSWTASLACTPAVTRWSGAIARGTMLGPRIHQTASYHIEDGFDLAALRPVLQALQTRGDSLIKLQPETDVDPLQWRRAVAAVSAAGVFSAAHWPATSDIADPAVPLVNAIEHDHSLLPQCLRVPLGYGGTIADNAAALRHPDDARCARVLARLARHAVAYTPTHVASSGQDARLALGWRGDEAAMRGVPAVLRGIWHSFAWVNGLGTAAEDRAPIAAWHAAALALTARAHDAGVPLLAGTDALDPYIVHGDALHAELALLVRAGLSPMDAIRAATITPARHMGLADRHGSIAPGKAADMVLLTDDPLRDIRNTRRIDTVIAQGRIHDRAHLVRLRTYVARQANDIRLNARLLWGMISG